jgi:hypothetical protein
MARRRGRSVGLAYISLKRVKNPNSVKKPIKVCHTCTNNHKITFYQQTKDNTFDSNQYNLLEQIEPQRQLGKDTEDKFFRETALKP